MFGMNVGVGLIKPDSNKIAWHRGKNTINSYGLNVMRNALIGAAIGQLDHDDTTIATDGSRFANMDSGYPLYATNDRNATWQAQKLLTSSLSFTNLQLALQNIPGTLGGSFLTVAQIPRRSLSPRPPSSIANGTTVIVRWTLGVSTGISATTVPGSDTTAAAQARVDDGKIGLANRIIGYENGSSSAKVKIYQYTGTVDPAVAQFEEHYPAYADLISTISTSMSVDGAQPRLVSSIWTYPSIVGVESFNHDHWAELYLGNHLARVFYEDTSGIARPSTTPNQTVDVILSSA